MANYCTLAQVKELLQAQSTDQDVLITALCVRATALIDSYTGRSFQPVTKTLRCDGDGSTLLTLPLSPVQEITTLTIDGTAIASDHWVWYEDGRLRLIGPGVYSARLRSETYRFTEGFQNIVVAGTFGYAAVPGDVEQAALMQVARWLRAKDVSFADTTGSPDGGQLVFSRSLYPEIKGILDRYRVSVQGPIAI